MANLSIDEFRSYVASKLPNSRVPCIIYKEEACRAAQTLRTQYDLGIALATDGLWLGYVFQVHGFPTKAVKLRRIGRGATWEPIDPITPQEVEAKRIILFDNDVVTGRTIKRAVKEVSRFSPEYIDLLLVYEMTCLNRKMYHKWKKKWRLGRGTYSSDQKDIWINTRDRVPQGIRKVRTLQHDFKLEARLEQNE